MLAVQAVRDAIFGINHIDDARSIQFLASCKDDNLIQLRHFEQEGIQTESLHCVYARIFAIEDDLSGTGGTSDSKSNLAGRVKVVWMRVSSRSSTRTFLRVD